MVLVMESDGSLTPSRSQSGFARNYNDGVGQGSAADGLAILGEAETASEPDALRFAALARPAPLPRADILSAIEATALRYAGHPGLRRAGLSVTDWLTLYRANIGDLGLYCDAGAGSGLYFPHLYDSELFRLNVYGHKAGIKVDESFSTTFSRIFANSVTGHAFDLVAGNTTLLQGCYAAAINGADKAGYRIVNGATLIACNSVNVGDICFQLEGTVGRFKMIGCNMEDFHKYGVRSLCGTISLQLDQCTFQAPSTGTYESAIRLLYSNKPVVINDCVATSKGATRNLAQEVVADNGMTNYISLNESGSPFNTVRLGALDTEAATMRGGSVGYAVHGVTTNRSLSGRQYGIDLPAEYTWTANASTYDMSGKAMVRTANTSATNFNATTGTNNRGERLTILVNDANTTIKHSVGGAGRFINKSGADIVAATGDVYEYVYNNSIWQQV